MNNQIKRMSVICIVMFLALMVSATYIQVIDEPNLTSDGRNVRTIYNSFQNQRGAIIVAGQEIASSTPANDNFKWQRSYADSNLYSHLTGYLSVATDSATGLESAYSQVLNGQEHSQTLSQIRQILTGSKPKGGAIELTINPQMQRAAAESLGNFRGAVVALDPSTGAVLAMYSNPTYDANAIANHNRQEALAAYDQLNSDKFQPLVNKSMNSSFPPGSTFKILTTATMLENGITPETILDAPQFLDLPDSDKKLPNFANLPCGNGKVSLKYAFGKSCNTAFAKSAMELGPDKLREKATAFGFNEDVTVSKLKGAKSVFPQKLYQAQLAYSSIGQYDVRATPLQMAVVGATIANKGARMKPYLVSAELDSNLQPVNTTVPEVATQAISAEVANDLKSLMEYVVTSKMTTNVHLDGVSIAAKTGTAQTGNDNEEPHSWLVGFAPAEQPQIAFAVIIEGGDQGAHNVTAAQASKVVQAVLSAGLK